MQTWNVVDESVTIDTTRDVLHLKFLKQLI